MTAHDPTAAPSGGGEARRMNPRTIAGLVLWGLAIAFALLNLNKVKVNWIVTTTTSPLIFVIIVSFLLGAGTGLLLERRRARRRRAR